jgi:hypothetical protein
LSSERADQQAAPAETAAEPAPADRASGAAPLTTGAPFAGFGGLTPAAVRQLQRGAGNRAVARLARQAAVQREVTISAQDLDPLMLRGGKRKGLFAKSSFGDLRKALAKYHAAAAENKLGALHHVEGLSLTWLNDHASSNDPLDRRRRPIVAALLEEINTELVAHSREAAQGVYASNIANALGQGDGQDPYALKQITQYSQSSAPGQLSIRSEKLRNELGLTLPEVTAIRVFTAEDYKYMNPVVANSPAWLADSKTRNALTGSDKLYIEEGTLHAGVAMQGLAKIKPWNETVYRGATFAKAAMTVKVGQILSFNSFASASKNKLQAELFAYTSAKKSAEERRAGAPDRDVGIIYEFRRPNGRDVTQFSLAQTEEEVVLLPGSRFRIEQLTPIAAPSRRFADTTTITDWWSAVCDNATPGIDADGDASAATSGSE